MITIEKINSSLFRNLYDSFLRDDDPLSNEQDWRNVFDYQWNTDERHCGCAMLDEGKVVGMLGMVFSERWIHGSVRKFCNLHTWWVREDHRGRSLALLRPVLDLDRYTITYFTPCDTIRSVTKRLGFETLNTQLRILLPLQILSRPRKSESDTPLFDRNIIVEALSEHDRKIFQDHLPYGCGHLLVGNSDGYCYVLYTHVVRHRLPYCHIHYISNKHLFTRHEATIRGSLLAKHNARFVALDDRLVSGMNFAKSFKFWAPAHGMYKSAELSPEHIDNLYSDVVFLKLTSLPHMSHELKQMATRMWPRRKARQVNTKHRPVVASATTGANGSRLDE